jgi:hypothetical protein
MAVNMTVDVASHLNGIDVLVEETNVARSYNNVVD